MSLVPDKQQVQQRQQLEPRMQEALKAHEAMKDSGLFEQKLSADQERPFRTLTDTWR
jgi:hypothetical protein